VIFRTYSKYTARKLEQIVSTYSTVTSEPEDDITSSRDNKLNNSMTDITRNNFLILSLINNLFKFIQV